MENVSGLADGKAPAVGRMAPTGQYVTDTEIDITASIFATLYIRVVQKRLLILSLSREKRRLNRGKFASIMTCQLCDVLLKLLKSQCDRLSREYSILRY